MHVFQQSVKFGAFPDKMEITKVSPIFQLKSKSISSKYRPISVFYGSLKFSKEQCIIGHIIISLKLRSYTSSLDFVLTTQQNIRFAG